MLIIKQVINKSVTLSMKNKILQNGCLKYVFITDQVFGEKEPPTVMAAGTAAMLCFKTIVSKASNYSRVSKFPSTLSLSATQLIYHLNIQQTEKSKDYLTIDCFPSANLHAASGF